MSENEERDKEFQKLSEIANRNKSAARYVGLIGAIAALIGLIISFTNVFHLTEQEIKYSDSLKVTRIVTDTLIRTNDTLLANYNKLVLSKKRLEKKLIQIISLLPTPKPFIPCTTGVIRANFEVDGDLIISVSNNSDDWFASNDNSNSGIGIIGSSAASAVPPLAISTNEFKALVESNKDYANRNFTYQQRMSVPPGSIINGNRMFDGFGARDNFSLTFAIDSTIFNGTSRNGDNPSTWSTGIGNVASRRDIVDIGAHIRQDLNSHNWLFAFATLMESSIQDSYLDFEFFSSPISIKNQKLFSSGGHTPFLFNPDGTTAIAGDVIIGVDRQHGGSETSASIRIWINPLDIDGLGHDTAYFNRQQFRSFSISGEFDSGKEAGGFGYAKIIPFTYGCLFWSVVSPYNKTEIEIPWGNVYRSDYSSISELAVDLTALLGSFSVGSMLFKTRASMSFTSPLQDYAGPFKLKFRESEIQ